MHGDVSRIAILGGTGKAGRRIAALALSRGLEVNSLSRRPPAEGVSRAGLRACVGDARDAVVLGALLEGCGAAVMAIASRRDEKPGFEPAARSLVAAMETRSIARLVVLVGLGIDVPGDRKGFGARLQGAMMKALFGPAMRDKQRGVDAVMGSGLEWTIVRAPLIEGGPPLGRVEADLRAVPRGAARADDLAAFILDAALGGSFLREAPFVASRR